MLGGLKISIQKVQKELMNFLSKSKIKNRNSNPSRVKRTSITKSMEDGPHQFL